MNILLFFLFNLFLKPLFINSFNFNITNIPFDIIGDIITIPDVKTCKITEYNKSNIFNPIHLCKVIIISPEYIITPHSCIIDKQDIFLLHNNTIYTFDYIIYKKNINIKSINNNLGLVKLKEKITDLNKYESKNKNIDNLYISPYNDSLNFSDITKQITINNNMSHIINKRATIYNYIYPNLKLNKIKHTKNLKIIDNYYYYIDNETNNIDIDTLKLENIKYNFNNNLLIKRQFNINLIQYEIICIDTIIYEYELNNEIINVTICIPLNDIYKIYELDINNKIDNNYNKLSTKYNIIPTIRNNIYSYINIIQYDKNCRIINNNIFLSNSYKLIYNIKLLLILLLFSLYLNLLA